MNRFETRAPDFDERRQAVRCRKTAKSVQVYRRESDRRTNGYDTDEHAVGIGKARLEQMLIRPMTSRGRGRMMMDDEMTTRAIFVSGCVRAETTGV